MVEIADAEHRLRLSKLQAGLRERGLDAFLVSSRENLFYLFGVVCQPLERPLLAVVRPEGSARFLAPLLEVEHVRQTVSSEGVEWYPEYPAPPGRGWADRLREMLNDVARIGIEYSLRAEISEQLTGFDLSGARLIEQLRAVKSPAEIERIRAAAGCAKFGVERLLASSYYGSCVAEGFAESRGVMKRVIRDSHQFNPLLSKVLMGTWAAPRSAQPHSVPRLDDRLLDGPHVALVLTTVDGYAAECERTYFTATPSGELRRAFAAMRQARRIALDMVRPGVCCGEIDAATREFLDREGYADRQLHRTGHGLGIDYHAEAPWLAVGSDEVLRSGMVISIEPGIYLPRVGGFRHSDTVLVADDVPELLTDHPAGLEQLVVPRWNPVARGKGVLVRRSLGLNRQPSAAGLGAA
jgi:Xaa-Pro dipeptidase